MAKTLTQYQTNVGNRTHHTATAYLDVITNFVNEAKELIIDVSKGKYEWLQTQSTLTFAVGDFRKEIEASLLFSSFDDPYGLYDETETEGYLTPKSWAEFKETAGWKPTTSTPSTSDYGTPSFYATTFIIDTTRKQYLYLDVPTDTEIITRLHFYRKLADLSGGSDTFLGMPDSYENAIEQYAEWKMLEYTGVSDIKPIRSKQNWLEFVSNLQVGEEMEHDVHNTMRVNNVYSNRTY